MYTLKSSHSKKRNIKPKPILCLSCVTLIQLQLLFLFIPILLYNYNPQFRIHLCHAHSSSSSSSSYNSNYNFNNKSKYKNNNNPNTKHKKNPSSNNKNNKNQTKKDYYQLLDISSNATPKEIQKAYRKKALQYHPDKVSEENREASEQTFKEIGKAYEVLSDEQQRKLYDLYGHDYETSGQQANAQSAQYAQDFFRGFQSGSSSSSAGGFPGNFFGTGSSSNMNSGSSNGFQFFTSSTQNGGNTANNISEFDLSDLLKRFMDGSASPNSPFGSTTTSNTGAGMYGNRNSGNNPFDYFSFTGSQQQHHPFSSSFQRSQSSSTTSKHHDSKPYERKFYCTLEELANPNGCTKKLKVTMPSSTSTSSSYNNNSNNNNNRLHEKLYTLHIKPGWKQGTKLKFGPSGDGIFPPITFILHEKAHAIYQRVDNDLIYTFPISPQQLLNIQQLQQQQQPQNDHNTSITSSLFQKTLTLPNGDRFKLKIKPQDINRNTMRVRIKGKGMPINRRNRRSIDGDGRDFGDLIVQFVVIDR